MLSLQVTPQITRDNKVLLNLVVKQDQVDAITLLSDKPPLIKTNKIQTNVLANNGETIVLGGIFEKTTSKKVTRVPFLGDLPGIGVLFRHKAQVEQRRELLIFVTPRILKVR